MTDIYMWTHEDRKRASVITDLQKPQFATTEVRPDKWSEANGCCLQIINDSCCREASLLMMERTSMTSHPPSPITVIHTIFSLPLAQTNPPHAELPRQFTTPGIQPTVDLCGATAERMTRGRDVSGSKLAWANWFFL